MLEQAHQGETQSEKIAESQQALRNMIRELRQHSSLQLTEKPDGTERFFLKDENKELRGEFLRDPEDRRVEKMHSAMIEECGEEGSETLDWLRHTIEKKLNDYYVIEDENGNIIAYTNTQYLTLGAENDFREPKRESGQSMLYIAHIKVDEAFQGKGVARELYARLYEESLRRARSGGHQFVGIIGEAVATVEPVLNRMGRKRIYYEDSEGSVHEIPYTAPPVEFSSETGEPLEDPLPEHLMIRMCDGREDISGDEILPMVRTLYREYIGQPQDYDSAQAYQRAAAYAENLFGSFKSALANAMNGRIFLMSREERDQKRRDLEAAGKKLY